MLRGAVRAFLLFPILFAAGAPDWIVQLQEASNLLRSGQYDKAKLIFEEVRKEALDHGPELAEAGASMGLGAVDAHNASLREALRHYQRAAELYERNTGPVARRWLPMAYERIISTAWELNDRANALDAAQKQVALAHLLHDPAIEGPALYSLAVVEDNPEKSLEHVKEGLAIAIPAGDRKTQGELNHIWADRLWMQGRYRDAQEKLTAALSLLDHPATQAQRARALTSQGRLHRTYSRYREAVAAYREALHIQEASGDRAGIRQSLGAMAISLDNLGRWIEARSCLDRALAVARSTGSNAEVASALIALGRHRVVAGQRQEALASYEEAVRLDQNLSLGWESLAYVRLRLGDASAALEAVEKAMARRPVSERRWSTLVIRAGALERLGRRPEAARDLNEAIAGMERERLTTWQDDASRIGFADDRRWFYSQTIDILARISPEEALAVAEQGRGRAFLDLLRTREVEGAAGPVELEATAQTAPFRAEQIAAAARTLHSTFVMYWAEEGDLLIWVVNGSGKVSQRRVPVRSARIAELVALVADGQRNSLILSSGPPNGTTQPATGQDPWRQLYRYLIAPLEPLLPPGEGNVLTIVPDGPLLRLPFAALIDDRGRYLVERFACHYLPSATVAGARTADVAAAARTAPLVVANPSKMPAAPNGVALPPLHEARLEAEMIARVFPGTVVLEGSRATAAAVVEQASRHPVLHFATHGILLEGQPFDSYLALSGGVLRARDIYRLHLSADLVVMSACRSGMGRISMDGVIGLTRAFLYAGSASVMGAAWDVADAPTVRLMDAFYRNYRHSAEKARALRSAQLDIIRALRAGEIPVSTPAGDLVLPESPLFWAPFMITGRP